MIRTYSELSKLKTFEDRFEYLKLTGTVGKSDYANVCILDRSYPMYYLNQRNAKLELSNDIGKSYLTWLLKHKHIKNKLTKISRGIRQANMSNKYRRTYYSSPPSHLTARLRQSS